MKVLEFYKWLQHQVMEQNIAEEAELLVLLSNIDGGYVYLKNPIIDEDGDIVLNDKD